MPDVVMPRLSESMESGTILKWLVDPGAEVRPGQRLVEIETDKATETYEAESGGVLEILAAEGDTLPIGAVIARLQAAAGSAPSAPDEPLAADPGTAKGTVTRQDTTRPQQVVARRVAEAKATIPELVLSADVDMENALALRSQLDARGDHVTPTWGDMVVKAAAFALKEFPRANGAYRDGGFELYSRINVGVVMSAADALFVPTILDADKRPLSEIAQATRALEQRVRAGEVTAPELSGGTFTVWSLDVTSFTAVVNPSQAAILAVGAMVQRAIPYEARIMARHVLPLTLSCDHRILYGDEAAQFLARIRELLENPAALLL
jgi:pyruvate dehydrogenase E2 component (dihydrolipoamide acetyltransferase)